MQHGAYTEDRVFGKPASLPPNSPVNRVSRSYDLLSIAVRGADVAYAQEGRVALPPLLFLHGWGASHKYFRSCYSAFSPRRRCIAPDLPGFGVSSKAVKRWSVDAYAAWLGGFLDVMKLDRVELVGHSMGGTIALLFALAHPERVSKLVVVNPVVHGASALSGRYRFMMQPLLRRAIFTLLKFRPIRERVCTDFTCAGPLDDELAREIRAADYRTCISSMQSVRDVDLRERVKGLAVPALSIGTELDRVVDPAQSAMVTTAQQRVFPGVGHIPMVECPVDFNRAVADFLDAR